MPLSVERLDCYYGEAVHALRGVTFDVRDGEIVAVVGANGAGKSTLLWTLVGLLAPRSGAITFDGRPVLPVPHQAVAAGIALVPERRRLFPHLTVRENLVLGGFHRQDRDGLAADEERLLELFPLLRERLKQHAGTLSGGQQQMLAIARGLMSRPRLLLLDEPSLGLAPVIVDQVIDVVLRIAREGTAVLLAEQNALRALEIAHRAHVLEVGRIVLSGSGQELLRDPAVQAAYLGVRPVAAAVLEEGPP